MHSFAEPSMTASTRLRHLILGWGAVGVVYTLTGLFQGQGATLPETALDRMIPFDPAGIWLYLSFFLLIPYAYFSVDAQRVLWLRRSMQGTALFCGLVFLLWPTTLRYPPVSGAGIDVALLRLLQAGDSSQNCLPSLHGALTLLCVWALLDARRVLRSVLVLGVGVGICVSIIQLRRHVSIDLGAGLAAGLGVGWICTQRSAWRCNSREYLS